MSETLFMIHGMSCGSWMWDNYKTFFAAKGFTCVTPTLRHHEAGPDALPLSLGTLSLLDYAADLEKEIRALDQRPILMGHSMGGLLAQILAARGLAKAVVLLAPAPPAGIFSLNSDAVLSFGTLLGTWAFWEKPFRMEFAGLTHALLNRMPESAHQDIYEKLGYESGRAAFEIGMWFMDPAGAAQVDAERLTCPVLAVVGEEDRITSARTIRKIADKYAPLSTYKKFPGHAHWLIQEPGWQAVAEYVETWMADKTGHPG
ncbi:alpha/beta hydrolase [Desulfonema ishimotonii]|uniref:Alpha/beta hydrolase n=1 Tax=Desulfonema ishimotonii TaxID=45657 RepID=A0A401FWQ2_9BACT|nr:alpha/beta hydrolase [Desulfonema ishimotonii]GBC61373.1 alpha/beta hydrolase [Desulfonema ishimotonii]